MAILLTCSNAGQFSNAIVKIVWQIALEINLYIHLLKNSFRIFEGGSNLTGCEDNYTMDSILFLLKAS